MIAVDERSLLVRIDRVSRAIAEQKIFIHRVPDPDTRERAEDHLITLVHMQADLLSGDIRTAGETNAATLQNA